MDITWWEEKQRRNRETWEKSGKKNIKIGKSLNSAIKCF